MDGFQEASWAWFPGVESVGRARRPLRRMSLFWDSILEATFFDLGTILKSFWKPKWRPKSIFGMFFGDVFFECVLASILGRFFEGRILKNH